MMAAPTAEWMFDKQYKGARNFMTPDVVSCEKIGRYVAYEVSSGTGWNGTPLYGATVVRLNPVTGDTEPIYDWSKALFSMDEVNEYIKQLKAEFGAEEANDG